MKEWLSRILAIIAGGLVFVPFVGDFSTKTRVVSGAIGVLLLLILYLLDRPAGDRGETS